MSWPSQSQIVIYLLIAAIAAAMADSRRPDSSLLRTIVNTIVGVVVVALLTAIGTQMKWFYGLPLPVALLCGSIFGLSIAGLAWWLGNRPKPDDTAIFFESSMEQLPITIPAHSSINIIYRTRAQMISENNGFSQLGNSGGEPSKWPPMPQKSPGGGQKFFGTAARCEVSNHGSTGFLRVDIPIVFNFGNEPPITYYAIIAPLDAGGNFVFYVANPTSDSLAGIWHQNIMVQPMGESKPRAATLRRKLKSPIDQVMILMPPVDFSPMPPSPPHNPSGSQFPEAPKRDP